ncbi:pre-mRNA cleavage factor Im 25 kDa subunit 1-like [Gossypium australe]|uniref:Pre-mRNA cleavage factor Im 25 kDa subunit 1-like n=1 Tax=Gossypium australe TaxID=47621 RepID=A0A5B6XBW9_9ROSI|nr:pre-mRNA cleavage factor Im 25 kDa subunit 1-like [Gossypium australe]
MVWLQGEDCGENLKKPKLPNRFRICSASKLSCIDCGVIFKQPTVQGRTQCITEAEKYGPKGQVKTPNGSNAKANKQTNEKPDIDINVGLSQRPPWVFLCKTMATSQQTLLLHAEGKKHI